VTENIAVVRSFFAQFLIFKTGDKNERNQKVDNRSSIKVFNSASIQNIVQGVG
jgi:hypothetical protein